MTSASLPLHRQSSEQVLVDTHNIGEDINCHHFLLVPHFSLGIRAEQCVSTELIERSVDLDCVVTMTMNPGLTINKDVCRKIVNTVSAPAAIGPYNQVIKGFSTSFLSSSLYCSHYYSQITKPRNGGILHNISVTLDRVFSCWFNVQKHMHNFTQAPKCIVRASNPFNI